MVGWGAVVELSHMTRSVADDGCEAVEAVSGTPVVRGPAVRPDLALSQSCRPPSLLPLVPSAYLISAYWQAARSRDPESQQWEAAVL